MKIAPKPIQKDNFEVIFGAHFLLIFEDDSEDHVVGRFLMIFSRSILKVNVIDNFGDNFSVNFGDNFGDNFSVNFGDNFRYNIWDNFKVNFGDNFSNIFKDNFSDNLGDNF